MSLTSILKKENGRANLKTWFCNHFPNPGVKKDANIIAPSLQTTNSGEVGTAFDYLFRFNLERINKEVFVKQDSWVSLEALISIQNDLTFSNPNKTITIGYNNERRVDRVKILEYIQNEFNNALINYKNFLKDGILSNQLIKSSIFLAKLDLRIRMGIIDANIDFINPQTIEELYNLFTIVPWDKFKAKNHCILNPTFVKSSALVGGADADLIIDNKLIDIKTTKNLAIKREDLNQIIGYYFLSLIEDGDNNKTIEIESVGIYFARYGYFWQKPLQDYYEKPELKKRSNEFIELIKDKNLILIPPKPKKIDKSNSPYIIEKNDFKCPFCERKNFKLIEKKSTGEFEYKCIYCKKSFLSKIETSPVKEKILSIIRAQKK